jgi:hypothetical protein
MNPEEEKYDLIERYLEGSLPPKDAEAFRQRMEQDADLRQEVQAHQAVHDLVMDQGLINLKQKLQSIHQNELRNNSGSNRWKLYGGIGALLLIGAASLYLYHQPATEPQAAQTTTIQPSGSTTLPADSAPVAVLPEPTEQVPVAPAPTTPPPATNTTPVVVPAEDKHVQAKTDVATTASEKQKHDSSSTHGATVPSGKAPDNPAQASNQVADCSQVQFSGTVSGAESCNDSPTGTIMIQLSSLKGGQKPYKFSLAKDEGYKTAAHFDQLEAATYEVWIKDKNNCTGRLQKVEIKAKNCPKEYVFAPAREQVWEIPLKEGLAANDIRIFNRGGQQVYQASLLQVFQPVWHGTDNSGISLPMGSYSFVIRYTNGEIEQGYVTVLQ